MRSYCLSLQAEIDLTGIVIYTAVSFGRRQAEIYKDDLKAVFGLLAENPHMGRRTESVRPGLRRHEHGSHIVFYMERDEHIEIVRVLPARIDWKDLLE